MENKGNLILFHAKSINMFHDLKGYIIHSMGFVQVQFRDSLKETVS